MHVGLSLSFCVADIISGAVRIEDVEVIHASTAAVTQDDWDRVVRQYSSVYWRRDPGRAARVVELLRNANRIRQHRIRDANYRHATPLGVWMEAAA